MRFQMNTLKIYYHWVLQFFRLYADDLGGFVHLRPNDALNRRLDQVAHCQKISKYNEKGVHDQRNSHLKFEQNSVVENSIIPGLSERSRTKIVSCAVGFCKTAKFISSSLGSSVLFLNIVSSPFSIDKNRHRCCTALTFGPPATPG